MILQKNKIIKILEYFDKNPKLKNFLYIPIFLIEYYIRKNFWKIIVNELLTKEEIVEFLDKQEFGYKPYAIYKMDVIAENTYFSVLNQEEAQVKIRGEFIKTLKDLITEHCESDVENYINLNVSVEIQKSSELSNNQIRIYSVYIRFYRELFFIKAKKNALIQSVIMLIIGISLWIYLTQI